MLEYPYSLWSTDINLSSEKSIKLDNQQETKLNLFNLIVGSSETLRGRLLCNPNFYLNKNSTFVYWLIGFTEGDGSFIINKTGYLEFKITQSSPDAQILFKIKKFLGFGSVMKQCKISNTHCFRVRSQKHLLIIIHLLNGKLHLKNRLIQFINFVNAYNNCYNSKVVVILELASISLNNAWLSGFTDAEGCFNISLVKRSDKYTQIFVRYILSQQDARLFFLNLGKLIHGKISYLKSYNGYNLTVNLTKSKIIVKYFTRYPLQTKKKIDYIRWLKVRTLVLEKKHRTDCGLQEIKLIASKINN